MIMDYGLGDLMKKAHLTPNFFSQHTELLTINFVQTYEISINFIFFQIFSRGTFSMWAAMLCGGEYYTEYGTIVPTHLQEY